MTRVIAFDPGKITGYAIGEYSDTEPLIITEVGAISYEWFVDGTFTNMFRPRFEADHTVVELFESRDGQDFAPNLLGVRVEGILDWWYFPVTWRSPSKKSQVPDQLLKDHGEWRTGAAVDWEDGRDANDAIIHLIGFVAFDLKHTPTLRKYFGPST